MALPNFLSNSISRNNGYLRTSGPSAMAGQYTTNVNGSQTGYSSHVPGQKRAWGDYPQQVPGQPYYSPQTRAIMQTPGYQAKQARALAAGAAEIEPSLSFQQQSANVDRFQNQQMAAINGSQAYQNGPNPAELAAMYRQQANNSYMDGNVGGLQNFNKWAKLGGQATSPAGIANYANAAQRGPQYAADMAAGQQTLENNYTGDGTAGPNGLYVSHVGGRGLALTSGGNARYQAENGAPYQGGGGMMSVDENGSEIISPTEGKNYLQIQANTLPEYRGNAARNALRTQSRREANGGLYDRQIRRNDQKMLELHRGIQRGALTPAQAEQRYKDYLGGSKPADAKMGSDLSKTAIRLPSGAFTGEAAKQGKAYMEQLQVAKTAAKENALGMDSSSNPATEESQQDVTILGGFGISLDSTGNDFISGLRQNALAISQMDPESKIAVARSLHRFAKNKIYSSDTKWENSNSGIKGQHDPSTKQALFSAVRVDENNSDDILKWLESISGSPTDTPNSELSVLSALPNTAPKAALPYSSRNAAQFTFPGR